VWADFESLESAKSKLVSVRQRILAFRELCKDAMGFGIQEFPEV